MFVAKPAGLKLYVPITFAPVQTPFTVLCTKAIKSTVEAVIQIGAIDPVNVEGLNVLTSIDPVDDAIQEPTFTEYNTVLVPAAANDGVNTPRLLTDVFADHVPPPGVAINACVPLVLHKGPGIVKVGFPTLIIVAVNVCTLGQFILVGVTTTLYITLALAPVIAWVVIAVVDAVGAAIPGPGLHK